MNKSLELNFWLIMYKSIVFLCSRTPEVYLELNIIYLNEEISKEVVNKIIFCMHI